MIRLVVLGTPVGQGHKRGIIHRSTGRAVVVENNDARHRSWREAVRSEAQDYAEAHGMGPLTGPTSVRLFFGLARPASAPKRRRTWPIGKRSGDLDTLARAILDSLTGVVFTDDAQVVWLEVGKDYTSRTGVVIEIQALGDEAALSAPSELFPLAVPA